MRVCPAPTIGYALAGGFGLRDETGTSEKDPPTDWRANYPFFHEAGAYFVHSPTFLAATLASANAQELNIFEKIAKGAVSGVKAVGGVVVRTVKTVGHAAGSVIKFIAGGDFPTPADYEPENLCVTAWTDLPKFVLLSALAGIIFPPALLYMGAYAPPSPVGLTAGIAQAAAKGGWDRVVSKILDPIYDVATEYAQALLDFSLNGKAALVRWALKKIAKKFPEDSVGRGIVLALSEAADTVIDAIRDFSAALKEGSFWEGVGKAFRRVAAQFTGNLRMVLEILGSALEEGAEAIATLVRDSVSGIPDALDNLLKRILKIPDGFKDLPASAKAALAKIWNSEGKLAGLENLFNNIDVAMKDFAETLKKLPFKVGGFIGEVAKVVAIFVERGLEYLRQLLGLANYQEPGTPAPPAPAPSPAPLPGPQPPPPAKDSGGLSKLLLIGAAGVAGALIGGPVGGVVGAGLGATLAKG